MNDWPHVITAGLWTAEDIQREHNQLQAEVIDAQLLPPWIGHRPEPADDLDQR